MAPSPVGAITRGTTNPNRLRRCDRWLTEAHAWRLRAAGAAPVVVDLGYGASPVTTLELRDRLRRVRPDVRVVGIEIDPARVAAAAHLAGEGLQFRLGGFEIPLPGGARPIFVRAFNVLRQYDEDQVRGHWQRVAARLSPDGLLIDGTCDEIGRRAVWVAGRGRRAGIAHLLLAPGRAGYAERDRRAPAQGAHSSQYLR